MKDLGLRETVGFQTEQWHVHRSKDRDEHDRLLRQGRHKTTRLAGSRVQPQDLWVIPGSVSFQGTLEYQDKRLAL